MWLQYGRDSYSWSYCWKRTSQNGAREDQDHQSMENTYESQGHQKFPRVHKLLPKIYLKLQSYSKTIEWTQRQERMDIEQRT